jgi:hypothetical protein
VAAPPAENMTPVLVRAARTLVAAEIGEAATSAEVAAGTERACEKLHRHLARVIGDAGMRALFGRSLSLGRREFPWLPVQDGVSVDQPWRQLCSHLEAQPPEVGLDASVHVIATLVGLVARFIGDGLTLRLLGEVCPAIPGAKETT